MICFAWRIETPFHTSHKLSTCSYYPWSSKVIFTVKTLWVVDWLIDLGEDACCRLTTLSLKLIMVGFENSNFDVHNGHESNWLCSSGGSIQWAKLKKSHHVNSVSLKWFHLYCLHWIIPSAEFVSSKVWHKRVQTRTETRVITFHNDSVCQDGECIECTQAGREVWILFLLNKWCS